MSSVRFLEITAANAGQRLDNFLLRELKSVPKTRIYRLIRKGEVRVNKGRSKPEYKLQLGDQVRIPPVRTAEPGAPPSLHPEQLQRLQQSILFENEHLLVFNKAPGMAVHSGTNISRGLIDQARQLRPDCEKLELVHRLDRGTSGCLVLAKNRPALLALQQQMQQGEWIKQYQALVWGDWKNPPAHIELPLLKRPGTQDGGRRVEVSDAGKAAHTRILSHARYEQCSWLQIQLETGRTHQIRVHCAHLGYPIMGDDLYANASSRALDQQHKVRNLQLHAGFLHLPATPFNADLSLTAALPNSFYPWMQHEKT